MFFFFSSRRRHTRFKCDWSSDVCSSDLEAGGRGGADPWSTADDTMLRKIARASMDRLAAFLRNPDAPVEADGAIAEAAEPGPQRKPQRRQRPAEAPSAAERLALSSPR